MKNFFKKIICKIGIHNMQLVSEGEETSCLGFCTHWVKRYECKWCSHKEKEKGNMQAGGRYVSNITDY